MLVGILLGACQWPTAPDTGSPYYTVPAGSILELRQSVTIPSNKVGVYLQGGQLLSGQLQAYAPYCRLEVNTLGDTARTIAPDRFTVTRVRHEVSYVEAARTLVPVQQDNGSPPAEIYATLLYLHSDKQPDVRRLRCAHYQYPPVFARHLSIDEIRTALGDIARLELPAGAQSR